MGDVDDDRVILLMPDDEPPLGKLVETSQEPQQTRFAWLADERERILKEESALRLREAYRRYRRWLREES